MTSWIGTLSFSEARSVFHGFYSRRERRSERYAACVATSYPAPRIREKQKKRTAIPIIMGALLVMTPAISDFFYQGNIVALMARSGVTSVTLAGQMIEIYRFGCWLTGTGMRIDLHPTTHFDGFAAPFSASSINFSKAVSIAFAGGAPAHLYRITPFASIM